MPPEKEFVSISWICAGTRSHKQLFRQRYFLLLISPDSSLQQYKQGFCIQNHIGGRHSVMLRFGCSAGFDDRM